MRRGWKARLGSLVIPGATSRLGGSGLTGSTGRLRFRGGVQWERKTGRSPPVVVLSSEGDPVLSSLETAHALNCPAMTQASPLVRFGVSWLPS
jgi:hypothetical protein